MTVDRRTDHGVEHGDLPELFDRIERASRSSVGHALFTITRFDPTTLEVERVHSSNRVAYPIGGRKQKRDTEFSRRILLRGETVVCEGDAGIAALFDDHRSEERRVGKEC